MKAKIVKGYELKQKKGEGVYSQVFKGVNIQTKQTVAIKVFKDLSKNDSENIKNEVNILKSLKHPNIISCLDYFQSGNRWYAVFQYCGKGDLQNYMNKQIQQNGRIPEDIAKSFIYKILDALLYLHQNKIAHRDLKLANILINDDYDVKLADFGLSKVYQEEMLSSFCGTPLLMAPEVLNRQEYTQKCDTWSLGIVSYYLLCATYPFKGKSPQDLKNNIFRQKTAKFPQKLSISQDAKNFIHLCLTINPKKRPTMKDLFSNLWFSKALQSQIRVDFMKTSMDQNNQISKKCNIFISHCLNIQIKKLINQTHMTQREIDKILKLFDQFYPQNKKIQFFFILLAADKNQHLLNVDIGLKIGSECFEIESKNVVIIQNHTKYITEKLQKKVLEIKQSLQQSISEKDCYRLDQKLIKFIIEQGYKYTQAQQTNTKKLKFFRLLLRFLNTYIEKSQIQISYAEQNSYGQFLSYVKNYVSKQKIMEWINNQDQDRQSEEYLVNESKNQWLVDYENKFKTQNNNETFNLVGDIVEKALSIRQSIDADKALEDTTL